MKLSTIYGFVFLLFLLGTTAQAQTEVRTPGDFTKVNSSGSWDVVISLGNKDEVKLVSKGFDLDKVITEVKDGKLEIKTEKGRHNNVNFTAYVTLRELEAIGLSGSGNMDVDSDIESRSFSIGNSGSGNIKMQDVDTRTLSVGMSGSGKVMIEGGTCESANIGQSGSGSFDALDLMAEDVKIGKSGSGSTSIGVEGDLKVASSGSGNVYIKGEPTNQSVASSGSGKVIRK
ncbi:head GIN domain-containing protein [Algoriphagus sp. SE2]|uniref:head GIN domain-containing protein n=1 Tax=Algoriphagus sp. SE2 TaxID=3141536 RepID=UPI0031CD388E